MAELRRRESDESLVLERKRTSSGGYHLLKEDEKGSTEPRRSFLSLPHTLLFFFIALIIIFVYNRAVFHTTTTKWAVISSNEPHTSAILSLAVAPDWSVVVVTSQHKPWKKESYPSNVHFITPDNHRKHGVLLARKINFEEETIRRNLGYLYAIKQGAEWIYDTDLSFAPSGKSLEQFDYSDVIHGMRFQPPDDSDYQERDTLFNPYRFLGRPEWWPRGFPLERKQAHHHSPEFFRSCRRFRRAAIQHSVLFPKQEQDIHPVNFTDGDEPLLFHPFTPPITLAQDTMTTWSSANTLFHRSSFLTLFLPRAAASHVAHIWRSLLAQRLLHLAGETVAVLPPNGSNENDGTLLPARQQMDAPSSSLPMISERMFKFMLKWQCRMNVDMWRCAEELAKQLTKRKLWAKADEVLYLAWLRDLNDMGYIPPNLKESYDEIDYPIENDSAKERNCRRVKLSLFGDMPKNPDDIALERSRQLIQHFTELKDWCKGSEERHGKPGETHADQMTFLPPLEQATFFQKSDVFRGDMQNVLIITNNWVWEWAIGHLQRLYMGFFGTIIFCGVYDESRINHTMDALFLTTMKNRFNYVRLSPLEIDTGFLGYYCLSKVAELRLQNVQGYVMMSDDVVYNHWQPTDYKQVGSYRYERKNDMHFEDPSGVKALKKTVKLITEKYKDNEEVQHTIQEYQNGLLETNYAERIKYFFNDTDWETQMTNTDGYVVSDWVYVPSTNISYARRLFEIFHEAGVFHEIAMCKFQHTVPTYYHGSHLFFYIWGAARLNWEIYYYEKRKMMHPMKLSVLQKPPEKLKYCRHIIFTHYRMLFRSQEYNDEWRKENPRTPNFWD